MKLGIYINSQQKLCLTVCSGDSEMYHAPSKKDILHASLLGMIFTHIYTPTEPPYFIPKEDYLEIIDAR